MISKQLDQRILNLILTGAAAILICALITGTLRTAFGDFSGKEQDTPQALTESSEEEIRAMWIATVANINFPSAKNLSGRAVKSEIDSILKTLKDNSMNTVIFQVRPSSDALYKSKIFPSSEFLCGDQGAQFPDGTDVLEYLISQAKKSEIKVWAWVNPLRVSTSMNEAGEDISLLSADNPAYKNPEYCVSYNGGIYYNPGIAEVRTLVSEGVKEIAANYDVDAILFDDYFYPYPVEGIEYDDSSTYSNSGTSLSLEDWRRENINLLVKESYNAVKSADPDCKFGVSPFGIWQNNDGSNGGSDTSGLSAYSAIYCDTLAWIKGGYIDFISPQIYWDFSYDAAPYATLVDWWDKVLCDTDIPLIISHAAYRAEEWDNQNEIADQVEYARTKSSYRGSAMYGYSAVSANTNAVADSIRSVY